MFKNKYLLEVNYKSGIQKQFWVYKFSISDGEWSWTSVDSANSPIKLNVDEVESVWQVGLKRFGFI
jgi:hypothetical protein